MVRIGIDEYFAIRSHGRICFHLSRLMGEGKLQEPCERTFEVSPSKGKMGNSTWSVFVDLSRIQPAFYSGIKENISQSVKPPELYPSFCD